MGKTVQPVINENNKPLIPVFVEGEGVTSAHNSESLNGKAHSSTLPKLIKQAVKTHLNILWIQCLVLIFNLGKKGSRADMLRVGL